MASHACALHHPATQANEKRMIESVVAGRLTIRSSGKRAAPVCRSAHDPLIWLHSVKRAELLLGW